MGYKCALYSSDRFVCFIASNCDLVNNKIYLTHDSLDAYFLSINIWENVNDDHDKIIKEKNKEYSAYLFALNFVLKKNNYKIKEECIRNLNPDFRVIKDKLYYKSKKLRKLEIKLLDIIDIRMLKLQSIIDD
jgi:hypothetical protein